MEPSLYRTARAKNPRSKRYASLREARPRSWRSSFHGTRVLRRLVRIRLELAIRDVVRVLLAVVVPLLGQVVQREDRRNGADRNAGAAVDALNRVDEELVHCIEPRPAVFVLRVLFRMDAIDRAGVHACGIFRSDARFGNDIRHSALPKTSYTTRRTPSANGRK